MTSSARMPSIAHSRESAALLCTPRKAISANGAPLVEACRSWPQQALISSARATGDRLGERAITFSTGGPLSSTSSTSFTLSGEAR